MDSPKTELEAKLAELDRDWLMERQKHLVRDRGGEWREPADVHRPVRDVLGSVLCVLGIALLSATPLPGFIPLLGLIPFGWYIHRMLTSSARVDAYDRAYSAYEARRSTLIRASQRPQG